MISPPTDQRLSTCWRIVFAERPVEARCSMKGRKHTIRASPGGKSFSKPIHERGQFARSRQNTVTSTGADGRVRFILEVFVFDISRRNLIRAMELTTILNHCYRHRGFVYQQARWGEDKKSIEIKVRPRHRSAAICSGCHKPAPGYDHLPERRFEFIPLWGVLIFLWYRMRRVQCRS